MRPRVRGGRAELDFPGRPPGVTVGLVARSEHPPTEPSEIIDASVTAKTERALHRWLPPARIANAVRAALAAMAAWLLGTQLPADFAEYAYAAPLGAFIATGTTVFTIARTALQQAVGLAIGAAVGLAMLAVDIHGLLKIGIIAVIGVLLQGAGALGIGAGVVPVVAVLVIIFGGVDADGYAVAYVGQFSVGLVVGVIVNMLVMPPLYDREARERIRGEVRRTADRVEQLAEMLRREWPPKDESWVDWGLELQGSVEELSQEVVAARESRVLNVRSMWRHHDLARDERSVATVRSVSHRMIDVLDAIAAAAWESPLEVEMEDDERRLTARAMDALAEHLRAWAGTGGVEEASAASGEAIERLYRRIIAHDEPESGMATLVFALRAMRERIDRAAEAEREEEASSR